MSTVTVLGAGSWGTTFAKVLSDAGHDVTLWARREEVARAVTETHRNPGYLSDVLLPDTVRATTDPRRALSGSRLVVLALPSQTLRANLMVFAEHLPADVPMLNLAKGVELGTGERMSQVVAEVTGVPPERIAVLSGPNLAAEIAAEQPTATVIACTDHDRAVALQHLCRTPYFRPYTNSDVIGCELAGAGKNVIALACGAAIGMGLGENTAATIITRGLAEVTRLGVALGAQTATFAGLAGLGDLVATCASPLSRNRSFGVLLGQGATVAEAVTAAHGQVAEGVSSATSIRALAAQHEVDMPITQAVHHVCQQGVSVAEMARVLLGRAPKPE